MKQIADFHIHSKYSRACSRDLNLANIDKTCRIKGVDIIGTGDFTYPAWFASIQNELEDIGSEKESKGLYRLKSVRDSRIKFILTSEVALIYKKFDKCRRVHIVIHAPNIAAAAELNKCLDAKYNIRSDGRPILGMSIEELCRICFKIHPRFLIYPAHIWTPWFAIFGSKSGFDLWADAFGEYADKIFAYETGLSSDPEMNWRISELDSKTLLSNSDAHSLSNIAREANVFNLEKLDYDEIYDVIANKPRAQIQASDACNLQASEACICYSIEFYPEEGMYHFDGHRDCGFSASGDETRRIKGICPKCKKPLILGVDYRVSELADRPSFKVSKHKAQLGKGPDGRPGYKKLVGLEKIIAEALNIKNRNAKKVQAVYCEMINALGPELKILMDIDLQKIKSASTLKISEGIKRVREGDLIIQPGFDGQYGVVRIFEDEADKEQKGLF